MCPRLLASSNEKCQIFGFILECSGKDWNQIFWSENQVVLLRTRLCWSAKCPIFQLCSYRPGRRPGGICNFQILRASLGSAGASPGMGLIHLFGYTHQGSLFYPSAQVRSWPCSPQASAELPACPSSAPQQPKGASARKQLCTAQSAHPMEPQQENSSAQPRVLIIAHLRLSSQGSEWHVWASIFCSLELCWGSALRTHSNILNKSRKKERKAKKALCSPQIAPLPYCSYERKILLPERSEPLIQLAEVVWLKKAS